MVLKILLAGDGGQGVQLIADVISQSVFEKDWKVTSVTNYGLEQRGGVSLNFITISDKPIGYPKFRRPDILLLLSHQACERTLDHQGKGVEIIDYKNFEEVFKKSSIPVSSRNIFFLGYFAKILVQKNICEMDCIMDNLEKRLMKKPNWEENKKAFTFGFTSS